MADIIGTIKPYEEYLKEARKSSEEQQKADIEASDALYDAKIKTTTDAYTKAIEDTANAYNDLYDAAEVQRRIDERTIAENMANSGLTDSGLNRTQQTALQLSFSNNTAKISRQKQAAVDALAAEMQAKTADYNAEKYSAAQNIRSGYDNEARTNAVKMYNNDVTAYTNLLKQSGTSGTSSASSSQYNAIVKKADSFYGDGSAENRAEVKRYLEQMEELLGEDDLKFFIDHYGLYDIDTSTTNNSAESGVIHSLVADTHKKGSTITNVKGFKASTGNNFSVVYDGNTYKMQNGGRADNETQVALTELYGTNYYKDMEGRIVYYDGDLYICTNPKADKKGEMYWYKIEAVDRDKDKDNNGYKNLLFNIERGLKIR